MNRGMARAAIAFATIATTAVAGATLTGAAKYDGDALTRVSANSETEGRIAPAVVSQTTTYKVVNITRQYNAHGTQELSRCEVGTNGFLCQITKTKSATRSIQTSFGLTRGTVAAGLNISASTSVSVSVGCSRTINTNQVVVAYPIGTKYTYRIQKVVSTFTGISTSKNTTYSGYLTAFSPGGASIYCVVKSK